MRARRWPFSGRVTYRKTCFIRVRMSRPRLFEIAQSSRHDCDSRSAVFQRWRASLNQGGTNASRAHHDSRPSRGRAGAYGKFTGGRARERAGNGADRGGLSTGNVFRKMPGDPQSRLFMHGTYPRRPGVAGRCCAVAPVQRRPFRKQRGRVRLTAIRRNFSNSWKRRFSIVDILH